MRVKANIIEMEGLAGCGKTTLCRELYAALSGYGQRVVYIDEKPMQSFFEGFKRYHINRYFQTFSFKSIYMTLDLFATLKRFRQWKGFFVLYEQISLYNYVKKKNKDIILICDQSVIQSIVSILGYDEIINLNYKEKDEIRRFFGGLPFRIHFLCDIPIEEDLKRIRMRARGHGRLDCIEDDSELKRQLTNNDILLKDIENVIDPTNKAPVLDMKKPVNELLSETMEYIIKPD